MSNFSTKIASTVGIVTIVATAMSATLVSAASEFLPYAEALADNWVISTQSTEAGYRLADTITRAELAKVTANLGGYLPTSCTGDVYGDVNSSLGDLCGYIEALAEAGVVSTNNANFRPTANVTRAEMTKMILGAIGETPSSTSAGYADVTSALGDLAGYINRANELGCAATATYFRPNASSSRGETFKIAACVAQIDPNVPVPTNTGTVTPTPTNTGTVAGNLTVALSGAAVAQYVPYNVSSVNVGTITLTAGATPVTVSSLQVARSGLGAPTDIARIDASQNGITVSNTNSDFYNSTSQVGNVYFSPALVVPANSSVSLGVLVSLASNAAVNSQHQFTVTNVAASNATVTGTPVTLGLLNTTSYATSQTTVTAQNSYNVNPGTSQQNIANIQVLAGSRDQTVQSFTLTRSGGVDLTTLFTNVNVYRNGVKVGTASVAQDKITVTGLGTNLSAGSVATYQIVADPLVNGNMGANNVVQFSVKNSSDLTATENATGYSTQVVTSGYSTVTVGSVQLTFVKTSTGTQNVVPGTSNVTLYASKLTSTVPLTVKSFNVSLTNVGTGTFTNNQVMVYVNGQNVGTLTPTAQGTLAGTINNTFTVANGTPATITLVGSIAPSAANASMVGSVTLGTIQDSNGNNVSASTAQVQGDSVNIGVSTLTVGAATVAPNANRTLYSNATQEIGRFGITGANGSANVTALTVTTSGSTTLVAGLGLSNGSFQLVNAANGAILATSTTVTDPGTIVFNNISGLTVAPSTTTNLVVMGVLNSITTYGTTLGLRAVTAITANDATTGNAVAVTSNALNAAVYTIGVQPPLVTVSNASVGTNGTYTFAVTVTNADSNTGITLANMIGSVKISASNSNTFTGSACVVSVTNASSCGVSAPNNIPGTATYDLNNVGVIANPFIDKNGSTTFYVYVSSPSYTLASGNTLTFSVDSLGYDVGNLGSAGNGASTQSYVNVAGASTVYTAK